MSNINETVLEFFKSDEKKHHWSLNDDHKWILTEKIRFFSWWKKVKCIRIDAEGSVNKSKKMDFETATDLYFILFIFFQHNSFILLKVKDRLLTVIWQEQDE